jgi:hypothetical protein
MRRLLPALLLLAGGAVFGQSYNGYFDIGDCSALQGWAWDANQPNTAINVDLYDDSTLIETVAANLYRADLQAAGIGNGYHSFVYNTSPSLKNGQNHTIHVKIAGSTFELNNSPRTINCPTGSTGYQYYYSDSLTSINSNHWIQNGSGSAGSGGYTSTGSGNLVSSASISSRSIVNYEVRMTIALTQSGGNYAALARASDDAVLGNTNAGSYYALEIANPTLTNGACSASLYGWKVVAGSASLLTSTTIPCHTGMVLRAAMIPSGGAVFFAAYVDNVYYGCIYDSQPLAAGAPGVSVSSAPSVNAISQAQLGPYDSILPNAIDAATVSVSAFPNRVEMQWQGVADDPNGTGIWMYFVARSDANHPGRRLCIPTRRRSRTPTSFPAPPIPTTCMPRIGIGTIRARRLR